MRVQFPPAGFVIGWEIKRETKRLEMMLQLSFWRWLFLGSGSSPGISRIVNIWLILHLIIGCTLAYLIDIDVRTLADLILSPLSILFFSAYISWGSGLQLLQTPELQELVRHRQGGMTEYVFTYQLVILIVLMAIIFWVLVKFRFFSVSIVDDSPLFGLKVFLLAFTSLTVRECRQITLGTQWLLLAKHEMASKRYSLANCFKGMDGEMVPWDQKETSYDN